MYFDQPKEVGSAAMAQGPVFLGGGRGRRNTVTSIHRCVLLEKTMGVFFPCIPHPWMGVWQIVIERDGMARCVKGQVREENES